MPNNHQQIIKIRNMLYKLNDSQTYYILNTSNYFKSEINSYKNFLEEDIRKALYQYPNLQELYSERMPFEFYAHEVRLSIVDYNHLKDVKLYKSGIYKPLIIPVSPVLVDSQNQQMPVANLLGVQSPSLNPFINDQINKAQAILNNKNNNSNNQAALTPIPIVVNLFNRTFVLNGELYFGNPDPYETVPELTKNLNSTFAYFFRFYRIPRPFSISDDQEQVTFPAYVFRELDNDKNHKEAAERCFTNRMMTLPETATTANNNNNNNNTTTTNNTNNQTSSQSTSDNSAQEDPFNVPLVRRPLRVRKLPGQRKKSKVYKQSDNQPNPVQTANLSQPVNVQQTHQPANAPLTNQQPANPSENSVKRKADIEIEGSIKFIRADVIKTIVTPKKMPEVRPIMKPVNNVNRSSNSAETTFKISNNVLATTTFPLFPMPQNQPNSNKPTSKMSINELVNPQPQSPK